MEHSRVRPVSDLSDGVSVRHLRVEGRDRAGTSRPLLVPWIDVSIMIVLNMNFRNKI